MSVPNWLENSNNFVLAERYREVTAQNPLTTVKELVNVIKANTDHQKISVNEKGISYLAVSNTTRRTILIKQGSRKLSAKELLKEFKVEKSKMSNMLHFVDLDNFRGTKKIISWDKTDDGYIVLHFK